MKTRSLAVALLASLAPALLPPNVAWAQGADEASTKLARQRFQEGIAFYDKGQYELARASFLQAYALRKHHAVLLNLAQSCLKSGHILEADRDFQTLLRDPAASSNERTDAERGLREVRTKLGRIDVSQAPAGAEIYIDEEREGAAPLDPIDVEPGSHTVRARGRTDENVSVTVVGGQVATARFNAQSSSPAAVSPPTPPPPPAASENNESPPPEPPPESPPLEPTAQPAQPVAEISSGTGPFSPPRNLAPVFVLGGISIAGFATAIVMGVSKSSAQNSANQVADTIEAALAADTSKPPSNICNPSVLAQKNYGATYGNACTLLNNNDNKVNTDAAIANVGLGIGIGAGVATLVYWLVASKGDDSTSSSASIRPSFTPTIARDGGGFSFGATF